MPTVTDKGQRPSLLQEIDSQPMPKITFRLPETKRPTLDQMKEWERHLCEGPDGNQVWMMYVNGYAWHAATPALQRSVIPIDRSSSSTPTRCRPRRWRMCRRDAGA